MAFADQAMVRLPTYASLDFNKHDKLTETLTWIGDETEIGDLGFYKERVNYRYMCSFRTFKGELTWLRE